MHAGDHVQRGYRALCCQPTSLPIRRIGSNILMALRMWNVVGTWPACSGQPQAAAPPVWVGGATVSLVAISALHRAGAAGPPPWSFTAEYCIRRRRCRPFLQNSMVRPPRTLACTGATTSISPVSRPRLRLVGRGHQTSARTTRSRVCLPRWEPPNPPPFARV